jgi:N-acetylglucosamine-6-phosphate deacetylase
MTSSNRASTIAFDGGGSGIRAIGHNIAGEVITHSYQGISHGEVEIEEYLSNIVGDFGDRIGGSISRAVLALAVRPATEAKYRDLATRIFQNSAIAELWICSDAVSACAVSLDGDGVVIVAGTGITALAIGDNRQTLHSISGNGYLIGDEGSAYWIGRMGLNSGLRALDGRGGDQKLLEIATAYFDSSPEQLPHAVHQSERPVHALAILHRASAEISLIAESARTICHGNSEFQVVLMGGVLQPENLLTQLVIDRLQEQGLSARYLDLQVNGHGGIDLLSASNVDDIRQVSKSLFRSDVIGYLPTIITCSFENAVRSLQIIEEARINPLPGEAKILGVHLEGPFISLEKCGVHLPQFIIAPSQKYLTELMEIALIKMVTLAPELPGALDLIEFITSQGIVVSLGHSDANREQAEAGFDAGAKMVTHLFNAMRKPPQSGLAEVALEREDVMLQIIVDDVHVPRPLVQETLFKASNRFILTNDAIAAAGLGTGEFPFGDMTISVKDGEARRLDGTLAGGIGNLDESLGIVAELGLPQADALASVTTRPAQLIGLNYQEILG